jgi:hypothetical protein
MKKNQKIRVHFAVNVPYSFVLLEHFQYLVTTARAPIWRRAGIILRCLSINVTGVDRLCI